MHRWNLSGSFMPNVGLAESPNAAPEEAPQAYLPFQPAPVYAPDRPAPVYAPSPARSCSHASSTRAGRGPGEADPERTAVVPVQGVPAGRPGMFRDTCSKEWAMNTSTEQRPVTPASARTCLAKENLAGGVVLFRDRCSGEWAKNPDQQAETTPAR